MKLSRILKGLGGEFKSIFSQLQSIIFTIIEYAISIGIGYAFAFAICEAVPPFFANVLFGKSEGNSYPYTFQMFMWLPFFIGLHDVFRRYLEHVESKSYMVSDLLDESVDKIYNSRELVKVLRRVEPVADHKTALLPKLIQQIIYKFQTNKSIEEATNTLGQFILIFEKNLELFYSRIRYLSWLIPTLGFIGTVYGISGTVAVVGVSSPDDPELLKSVASNLAVAFDTTLLALVQSSILLYVTSVVESAEEKHINQIYQYTFEHLVNRLDPYEQTKKPGN